MLSVELSDNELQAIYGLRTTKPTQRSDVLHIDQPSLELGSITAFPKLDIKEEEQYKLLDDLQSLGNESAVSISRHRQPDPEDPLKGRGSNVIQDLIRKQVVETPTDPKVSQYLISSQEFSSYRFLTTVHGGDSLEALGNSLKTLENNIRMHTDDLKDSIDDNFDSFIDCKQVIDRSLTEFVNQKTKVRQDKENSKVFNPRRHKLGGSTGAGSEAGANAGAGAGGIISTGASGLFELSSELELSLNNLITTTNLMIRPISDNRTREEKIGKVVELVKNNDFFFNLSSELIKHFTNNDNFKFIDTYNRYIREKDIYLDRILRKIKQQQQQQQQQSSKAGAGVSENNDLNALRKAQNDYGFELTLMTTVFHELDAIAEQYRNKVHGELLSLDFEVGKNGKYTVDLTSGDGNKFAALLESLAKMSSSKTDSGFGSEQEKSSVNIHIGPVRDFLIKQIEIIDKDFEYHVRKYDNKFLLMQKKITDYVQSLAKEKRDGSHVNYILDKYDKYSEERKFVKSYEDKLLAIEEAFDSNDLLDLSLVNETWLVLVNFVQYLEILFLRLAEKFLNNYTHYFRLGADPDGVIRNQFIDMVNRAVSIMAHLFDGDVKEGGKLQNQEMKPSYFKSFVPCYANSLSTIYHLGRIQVLVNNFMQQLGNLAGTLGNVSRYSNTNNLLKSLKSSSLHINTKILEAICSTWVNDCLQFSEMEDWKIEGKHNAKDGSCTKLMSVVECYQLYMIRKISKVTKTRTTSKDIRNEFNVVSKHASKQMLTGIEIQFMRTLKIIIDSMIRKYDTDRNINDEKLHKSAEYNVEIFKVLSMNNFDKLSRITYYKLLKEFDKHYLTNLGEQNLELIQVIEKARVTIIEDILKNEKAFFAKLTLNFFARLNPKFNDYGNGGGHKLRLDLKLIVDARPKVDAMIYEVLLHFVKLVNRIKPLTSENMFVTLLSELQNLFLKDLLSNVRNNQHFFTLRIVKNLLLDCYFLSAVFERSKQLKFDNKCKKLSQVLVKEISNIEVADGDGRGLNGADLEDALQESLENTAIQFNCF